MKSSIRNDDSSPIKNSFILECSKNETNTAMLIQHVLETNIKNRKHTPKHIDLITCWKHINEIQRHGVVQIGSFTEACSTRLSRISCPSPTKPNPLDRSAGGASMRMWMTYSNIEYCVQAKDFYARSERDEFYDHVESSLSTSNKT